MHAPNLQKIFAHALLTIKGPIRAALTFLDLSSDTKFGPSQSRETLPLRWGCGEVNERLSC